MSNMRSQLMEQVRQARTAAAAGQSQAMAVGRRQEPMAVEGCASPYNTAAAGKAPKVPAEARNWLGFSEDYPNPLTILAQTSAQTQVVEIEIAEGLFLWCGLKSSNDFFQVMIDSVRTGNTSRNRNPGPVDAGVFNTIECFCPYAGGCVSTATPGRVTFSAIGTPSVFPVLGLHLWGYHFEVDDCVSPFDVRGIK